ncbi:MAG: ABC transporter ATP-binding protein [Thermoplasmatota archaeon]
MTEDILVEIKDVKKFYPPKTTALDEIDLKIFDGDWTMIMGPSGSGKTTLLNLISCLDRPTSGEIKVLGENPITMSDRALAIFRRNNIGMIFQQYHLIPYLSALENVEIAQYFHSIVDRVSARDSLVQFGMKDRLDHIPSKLSGGEQQRVSIARALINEPRLVLADEPTGNLDRRNGIRIMEILKELNSKGMTIVFVTHDNELASWGNRIVKLEDGRIIKDIQNDNR